MENRKETSSRYNTTNSEMDSDDDILLNINNFYLDEDGDAIVNDAYDQYLNQQPSTSNQCAIGSSVSNNSDQNSYDRVNSENVLLDRAYNQYEENLRRNVEENDEIDQLLYDAVSGFERDVRRIATEHDYINVGKI